MNDLAEEDFYDTPRWGHASDRRGLGEDANGVQFVEHAVAFLQDHPTDTVMSAETLDLWLQAHGLLVLPSPAQPKDSDAWMAHTQRRNQIRARLNAAANHPRMAERGGAPFILVAIGRCGFEVRAPHVALSKSEAANKVASLTVTKRKQLARLMQSAGFDQLPPYERAFAEELYTDIEEFSEDIITGSTRLSQKFARLARKIKSAGVLQLSGNGNGEEYP